MRSSGTIHGLLLATTLCGCGVWDGTRHAEQTVEQIDARLTVGMTLAEFEGMYPDAHVATADGATRIYVISEQAVCFVCTSPAGFQRSTDVFARAVRFESGRLISVEPVPELPR